VTASTEFVSIIIVTLNTRDLTLAAIQSVFDSRDGVTKEVVVVDNGSTDGTETAVCERFPEVKYRYSELNLGFARANNLGARIATGDRLLLLNSDARLKPDSLGKAFHYLHRHPECGVLGGQLLNEDGSRQNSIASFPTLATELLSKSLLRRLAPGRYPGKEHCFAVPVEVDSVIGAFLLTPRRVWDAVGGFDERYFFFFEETDYCLQVKRRGWTVVHHPDVDVWHFQGGTAKRVQAAARIEYWRSRYRFFEKNGTPRQVKRLRLGLRTRLSFNWMLNGIATLLTVGAVPSLRRRFAINQALARWHLAGCPDRVGIPR
jgi:GT2 family glycosyltransferase